MESFAPDLKYTPRVSLSANHVEAIRSIGEEVHYKKNQIIAHTGDRMDQFIYVLEGEIELIDPYTMERYLPNTLGPTQFVGEMAFLYGGTYTLPVRAAVNTTVIKASRKSMLVLMSRIPELSDIIINVYNGRRRRQIEAGDSSLILIGEDESKVLRQIATFANRSRIPFRSLTVDSAEAVKTAATCGVATVSPMVIFGKNTIVEDPTPRKIAVLLGLDLDADVAKIYDVLIVGGGPAGVAAGVYAGAEGLSAVVMDELAIGGQAGTSSRIENYMGFPTGISGADLLWRGQVQAMKFGTEFAMPRRIVCLEKTESGEFRATVDDGSCICARSIVIATGVQYRKLPLDRLSDFEGAGIYYAATDSEARYCGGKEVAVIGGGNSAGQAAMYLCRSARHVHVLVRGSSLADSMSSYLSQRLEAEPSISLHYNTETTALDGGEVLEAIQIRNRSSGAEQRLSVSGLFVMVGAAPNTDWLANWVELDNKGFVKAGVSVGRDTPYETSCPGLFAVGDVRTGSVKRVASGVGEGSVVISHVWHYVNSGQAK